MPGFQGDRGPLQLSFVTPEPYDWKAAEAEA